MQRRSLVGGRCWIGSLRRSRWAGAREASGRCRSGREPGEAGHVGDQVGEPELGRGPGQADRADDQAQTALLGGEDVLDRDPDPRPAWRCRGPCAAASACRAASAAGTAAPARAAPAARRWPPSGRRCRPRPALAVLSGSSSRPSCRPSWRRGVGDREAADEAVPAVDTEVVLVAEHRC